MSDHEHHHHHHAPEGAERGDRNLILLRYTADHNDHHASELAELEEGLRSEGRAAAADMVLSARKAFEEGNEYLHKAISLLEEV